jgi:hypothetical protein
MTYRVKVTIEVVNEDDEVVDHRGWVSHVSRRDFKPLRTTQYWDGYDYGIQQAHKHLNSLFKTVQAIGEINVREDD